MLARLHPSAPDLWLSSSSGVARYVKAPARHLDAGVIHKVCGLQHVLQP